MYLFCVCVSVFECASCFILFFVIFVYCTFYLNFNVKYFKFLTFYASNEIRTKGFSFSVLLFSTKNETQLTKHHRIVCVETRHTMLSCFFFSSLQSKLLCSTWNFCDTEKFVFLFSLRECFIITTFCLISRHLVSLMHLLTEHPLDFIHSFLLHHLGPIFFVMLGIFFFKEKT